MSPGMHLRWTDYVTDSKCISAIRSCIYLGPLYTRATPASISAMCWVGPSWWHSLHHWPQTSGETSCRAPRKFQFSIKFQLELSDWKFSVPLFFISHFLLSFLIHSALSSKLFLFNLSLSSVGSALLHTFYSQLFPFHFSNHLFCHSCPRI